MWRRVPLHLVKRVRAFGARPAPYCASSGIRTEEDGLEDHRGEYELLDSRIPTVLASVAHQLRDGPTWFLRNLQLIARQINLCRSSTWTASGEGHRPD